MKKVLIFLSSCMLVLALSGCGAVESRYRYGCQDPANWEKAECQPPICETNGTCTKDLVKNYGANNG